MNSEFRFRLTVNLIDVILIVILIILMCLTSSFDCAVQSQSPATNEKPFASILYTAVVRGKVALPCDITAPASDDGVVLILWYKDDQHKPIYTMDARRGTLEQARTLVDDQLEGRAYFNTHNRPAFLQIDPIRLSDAGDYRCRVDFRKGRTVNTVISLKVIVPPEDTTITDVDGNELKGLIGPYNEGDELKLICTTEGGKPRPSLTWWRDYSIIDDSFEYDNRDVTTNQLTISLLAPHHLLLIFTCQAINNNITVPSSTSVTLDLNLKPIEVRITQLTPILVADKEAMFECNTFGSRPKAILYWIFDGKRHNTQLNGELQTSTTLTITLKQVHNGASLICVAENAKISNSAISDQIKLDVQYIPQLSLQLGTTTISLQSIQEGNDIYFDCHIDSNPRLNAPIVWRFNGNVLHPQQGIIQSNVSLVLQSVKRYQSGSYQCEASNQQGIALSNAIHLKIRFAPVCLTEYSLVYGVSMNEVVNMECDVDANPSQVSFQWKFKSISAGTSDLTNNLNQINDTSSILSYAPHSSQDYGEVECIAKNSIGIQQRPCRYIITESKRPDFKFVCQLLNQSDNSLVILCSKNSFQLANYSKDFNNNKDNSKHNMRSNDKHSSANSNSNQDFNVNVYPSIYYVCEVYDGNYLAANISIPATITPSQLQQTQFVLSDSSMDNSISNIPPSLASSPSSQTSSSSKSFQIFIPNLKPATNFKLKIFASSSKGPSEEHVYLDAQTLRPAERLIKTNESVSTHIFRGKAMIMALLIGAAVITLIVIALGIIAVVRVRRSANGATLLHDATDQPQAAATLFHDEECMGCCDEDCCDEMLLTSTGTSVANSNQLHHQIYQNGSKGPPDIIPSFGYNGEMDKNYDSYGYHDDSRPQFVVPPNDALHYAELHFGGQQLHQMMHQQVKPSQPVGIEYAKIDFNNKTQRVNLVGGSPKFESTV